MTIQHTARLALLALVLTGGALWSPAQAAGIKRMYVLDCGRAIGRDQSLWTPGYNVGKKVEIANSCYLIQHERGTLLWETGLADGLVKRPKGVSVLKGALILFRDKTLVGQLAGLGVKPDQIDMVALSHLHPDHIGNVKLFPKSKVLMQAGDVDILRKAPKPAFAEGQTDTKLNGDLDVFGDGSVTILATPGHTPGHQSLLVKLPKTGAVILTGDAVHFQVSWARNYVPKFNADKDMTLKSIARLKKLAAANKAKVWIGHDKPQTDTIKRAPAYYD
jgi:N-acyl homoserine lactone hydrolase